MAEIRAWRMHEPGSAMRAETVSSPSPDSGDVLVRVAGCGVCHTDIGFFYEGVRTVHEPPLTLGHEISGQVEEDGIRIELGLLKGGSDILTPGTSVDVLLRPDDIVHDDDSKLTAMVCHKEFRGADILYTLCLDCGDHLYALVPSHHAGGNAGGERVLPERLHVHVLGIHIVEQADHGSGQDQLPNL